MLVAPSLSAPRLPAPSTSPLPLPVRLVVPRHWVSEQIRNEGFQASTRSHVRRVAAAEGLTVIHLQNEGNGGEELLESKGPTR